jgi:hypothetical protein
MFHFTWRRKVKLAAAMKVGKSDGKGTLAEPLGNDKVAP